MNRLDMNHLDLLSGAGGFALAAQKVWGDEHNLVAFCEKDKYCQKVLNKHWPDTPVIGDIFDVKKELQKSGTGTIDLVTGGFPCQPFSCAGKRKGRGDDRYLWPEMLAIISEFRPRWVIGENVAGLVSMGERLPKITVESKTVTRNPDEDRFAKIYSFEEEMLLEEIFKSIEAEGYTAYPVIISALGVGARHLRERLWIVAHANNGPGLQKKRAVQSSKRTKQYRNISNAPSSYDGQNNAESVKRQEPKFREGAGRGDIPLTTESKLQAAEFRHRWLPEPRVRRVVDGFPGRVDRIRALGNAIVPQVVEEIFRHIKIIEET